MLQDLAIESVRPDPKQPRTVFDEKSIRELGESIKERGLLQPITVRPNGTGFYIITGERRYKAHRAIGALTIKAIVEDRPLGNTEILANQLIENMQRADMNPIDTAKGLKALEDSGWMREQIARTLGYSLETIERKLSLNSLDPRLQKHVSTGQIPETTALLLTKLSTEGQYLALRRIKNKPYSQAKPIIDAILEAEQQIDLFVEPGHKRQQKSLVKHYSMAMLALTSFIRKITGDDYRILANGLDDGKIAKRILEIDLAAKGLRRIKRELETYQQGKRLRKKGGK